MSAESEMCNRHRVECFELSTTCAWLPYTKQSRDHATTPTFTQRGEAVNALPASISLSLGTWGPHGPENLAK